eukprot:jgi/Psemu1/6975/gm1.6975_g
MLDHTQQIDREQLRVLNRHKLPVSGQVTQKKKKLTSTKRGFKDKVKELCDKLKIEVFEKNETESPIVKDKVYGRDKRGKAHSQSIFEYEYGRKKQTQGSTKAAKNKELAAFEDNVIVVAWADDITQSLKRISKSMERDGFHPSDLLTPSDRKQFTASPTFLYSCMKRGVLKIINWKIWNHQQWRKNYQLTKLKPSLELGCTDFSEPTDYFNQQFLSNIQ